MRKQLLLLAATAAATLLTSACAITDFDGFAGHKTVAESKLWGAEIAFSGTGDPALDGTYSYTVTYDNRGGRDVNMKIVSYRNPVVGSFSNDGIVDRDGDDIQGRSGILGGSFSTRWVAVDAAPDCQFFTNITQSHGPQPGIAFCTTTNEEVDKDFDLQASFTDLGDLLSQIWSGAVNGAFTLEVTSVSLDGVHVPIAQPLSIGAQSNGVRPIQFSLDLSQPGTAGLVQAILDHTSDGVPVSLGIDFAGGMSVDLPGKVKVVFDHETLAGLL